MVAVFGNNTVITKFFIHLILEVTTLSELVQEFSV